MILDFFLYEFWFLQVIFFIPVSFALFCHVEKLFLRQALWYRLLCQHLVWALVWVLVGVLVPPLVVQLSANWGGWRRSLDPCEGRPSEAQLLALDMLSSDLWGHLGRGPTYTSSLCVTLPLCCSPNCAFQIRIKYILRQMKIKSALALLQKENELITLCIYKQLW